MICPVTVTDDSQQDTPDATLAPTTKKNPWPTPPSVARARTRLKMLIRHDFKCFFCRVDFRANIANLLMVTVDHLTPRMAGGETSRKNTVPCCLDCSGAKGCHKDKDINRLREYVLAKRARRIADVVVMLAEAGVPFPRDPGASDYSPAILNRVDVLLREQGAVIEAARQRLMA